jgi:hypothetical protein
VEDMSMIDPIEYGKLLHAVEALEGKVSDMEADIKKLVKLADQSKGGFWVGMTIASIIGGIITYVSNFFIAKP